MSRSFFVAPAEVRLPLFGDDTYYITVKQELNAWEGKRLAASAMTRLTNPEKSGLGYEVDLAAAAFEKVLLYLIDWNLTGPDGAVVGIQTPAKKADALRNLDSATFTEIERVIDAHVLSTREKKRMTGSLAPGLTS